MIYKLLVQEILTDAIKFQADFYSVEFAEIHEWKTQLKYID